MTLGLLAAAMAPSALSAAAAPPAAVTAMFRGGPQLTGVYPGPAPRRLTGIRFVFRTGGPIRGSAAVANGSLYIGSTDGALYALDALTGRERWHFQTGGPVSATPAVAGDSVYVTSRDGALYAIATATGRQRWRLDLGRDLGHQDYWDFYTSSPTPYGNRLYVGSGSGALYAVDRATGHVAWRAEVGARIRSTPAVTDQAVVFGTASGHVVALDRATGAGLWRFATEGAGHTFATAGNDTTSVFASPTIAEGIVTVGGRDGMLYGLDLVTGRQIWRTTHDGSSWILSTAAEQGMVYVGSGSAFILQAANLATGAERWRFPTGAAIFGSPAISGDVLLFDDMTGMLHALDKADGRELWNFALGDMSLSSPVVAGGIVYAAADNGLLYALDSDAAADPAPSLRRLVYAEPPMAGSGVRFFPPEVAAASLGQLRAAGFEQIGAEQLLQGMNDQIAHPDRHSLIVFTDNLVPPAALAPADAQAPLRRYLEAGGRVLFLGENPVAYVRDPASGAVTGRDPDLPAHILDLHYPAPERTRGWHVSTATADGRRWGLPDMFVSNNPIDADQVTRVLARDEFGYATAWVRAYGTNGGRLIQVAMPRRSVADLHALLNMIDFAAR